MLRHLHAEVAATPADTKARALLEEVFANPGVPDCWRTRETGNTPLSLMTTVFRGVVARIAVLLHSHDLCDPRDLTLEELRIGCMFPVDEAVVIWIGLPGFTADTRSRRRDFTTVSSSSAPAQ